MEQGRDPASLGRVAAVVVRYVALLALPMTLGAAALSPSIVHLLYGAAYAPAVPVFAILAAGAALVAFLASAQNLLIATEKQGLLLRWTLAVAAFKVLLDLLIVPKGGAVGAAFANALSQSVAVIGMWIYITRRLAFPAPLHALFRTALAAAASATLAALCGFLLPPLARRPRGNGGGGCRLRGPRAVGADPGARGRRSPAEPETHAPGAGSASLLRNRAGARVVTDVRPLDRRVHSHYSR